MLKKRLVGVITVRNGWAVQSCAYRRYLPLGRPEILAENLDRWGADEILIQSIDRTAKGLGPDLGLLGRLGALSLSTPLTYAGGVASAADASAAVQAGAERVCIDASLHGEVRRVEEIAQHIGSQALVACLPLTRENGVLRWFDYRRREARPFSDGLGRIFDAGLVSEALVIDSRNEGVRNGFDFGILSDFPFPGVPLIAFGGLSEPAQIRSALQHPRAVAVGVGNFLNYAEHSVQHIKQALSGIAIRPETYRRSYRPV